MITLDDIRAARERIADVIVETPCVRSSTLSEELDAEVWLKCEGLQRTGSFKTRGALNRILTLPEGQRSRGVIAASAGNHAQGVAFAASRVGISALIVMPETTPLVKISQTGRWGAEVELFGQTFDEAYARAREIQEERGLTFVHPFDDEAIIAGQGTLALELVEQVPDLEVVVSPIGGGGFTSGVATGIKTLRPEARVFGVQTEASPAMARSLKAGELTPVATRRSIAEGIAVKSPGRIPFEHIRAHVDDIVVVDEQEIEQAIFRLLEVEKLVTEGAGAASYAAVRHRRVPQLSGRKVVAILTGANIDLNMVGRLIERSLVRQHRISQLRLTIQDRPGALEDLLGIVADSGANVLNVQHNRNFSDITFWETEVELTLEIRDEEHVLGLLADLRAAGYGRIEQPGLRLTESPRLGR